MQPDVKISAIILLAIQVRNAFWKEFVLASKIIFDILNRLLQKPQAVKARAPLWTP